MSSYKSSPSSTNSVLLYRNQFEDRIRLLKEVEDIEKVLLLREMSINMEFRNVVFNAARDGKLRRLKVRSRST